MKLKFAWMQTRSLLLFAVLLLCGTAHAQIVAFGASNISGWNVAASESTPAQLQSMLREKGSHVSIVNAGIYGNTTPEMRARMDKDIPDGTTIVILDISGGPYNNARKGISREQGESDLVAIKARLEERQIKVITFSAAEFPTQYHQQDGIHLTPEGHRLAATNLLPQITEILGPPAAPQTVRAACAADAHRLCAAALGDDSKRQQCMHEHRSELSKDCLHAIVESRQRQNNN
jgi:acyl-CoA thioesterase I